MRFRKLRIAWSVAWGIVCVLFIVLWVWSYWHNVRLLQYHHEDSQGGFIHLHEWIDANDKVRVRHKGKLIVTDTMSARHTLHRRLDPQSIWKIGGSIGILFGVSRGRLLYCNPMQCCSCRLDSGGTRSSLGD